MITAGATPTPKTIDQRRVALTSPQVKTLQTDNAGTLGATGDPDTLCPVGPSEAVDVHPETNNAKAVTHPAMRQGAARRTPCRRTFISRSLRGRSHVCCDQVAHAGRRHRVRSPAGSAGW